MAIEKSIASDELNQESRKVFCCKQTFFYKPTHTDHEDLFKSFIEFENNGKIPLPTRDDQRGLQVVKQVNFGPIEEKRYFALPGFEEVSENEFNEMGYKRLNSFKNLKCNAHNKFFELNAYRKQSAYSNHHQSTIQGTIYPRDSSTIDLASGQDKGIWNRQGRP